MSDEFALPDVGEGLTEADIVSWKVAPGDTVGVNQILVEIETAKSLVELPSPQAGTIGALLVNEGDTVDVGTPIVRFGEASAASPSSSGSSTGGSSTAAEAGSRSSSAAVSADSGSGPNLVGYGTKPSSSRRRARKGGTAEAAAPASVAPAAPTSAPQATPAAQANPAAASGASSQGRPLAKPPVRKLAKDKGIDLGTVTATGEHGEVTREDLARALSGGAAPPAALAAPVAGTSAREERIPFRGVTKVMAQAMVESAFTAPHVTEFLDVDVTRTMEFVAELKATKLLGPEVRVSPLLLVAKAVTWAAARNPRINATLDGEEIVVKHYVNLGIAAATDRGLIVPNIKDAHAMGLTELAEALGELVAKARSGKTTPAEQAGGTITITNVGVFGIDAGTPIINPGESAILAFGKISKRPWVVDDEIVPRHITTLSVSADHRVVDGEAISRFLADVGRALENPLAMLA